MFFLFDLGGNCCLSVVYPQGVLSLQVTDPLLLGCVVSLVEALQPILKHVPTSLVAVLEILFSAVVFQMEEDAAQAGKLDPPVEGREKKKNIKIRKNKGKGRTPGREQKR